MSGIHYFQRYSQAENVVTNNTLLLFSRLYHFNPLVFQAFLSGVLDDVDISIGPTFEQQVKAGTGSIPDGILHQPSFKVVLETKLYENYRAGQLAMHLSAFNNEQNQILLHLSPRKPDSSFQKHISEEVDRFNDANGKRIKAHFTTFRAVIEGARNVLPSHFTEMAAILDDFEGFCTSTNLIPTDKFRMRVVTCGDTLEDNFRYDLYYHTASRSYQPHLYVGTYADKSVRGIGKIRNIVEADYSDGRLSIITEQVSTTENEKDRIVQAMKSGEQQHGYDMWTGRVFFLFEKLHETSFRKISPYGLQGTRYFDLSQVLDVRELPDTEEIAKCLGMCTWT